MKSKFYLFVIVFAAIINLTGFRSFAHVPDTGQTKCYDNSIEILCPLPDQPFYGQDGNYTINSISYTKLDIHSNTLPDTATSWAMVRDNVTGLIWENKTDDGSIHDKDNQYTWYDSNQTTNGANAGVPGEITDTEDFLNVLNDTKFGGYSDWRLPTPSELSYIANYSVQYSPPYIPASESAITKDFFPYSQSSFYWTDTTTSNYHYNAWGVYFYDGHTNFTTKTNKGFVRAVRGGKRAHVLTSNLILNGNGTVTDINTGLTWQQTTATNSMNWENALIYCENLNLGGYTDWRLPTIKELQSIVDYKWYSPAVDVNFFPDTYSTLYWAGTTPANDIAHGWTIDFLNGYSSYQDKNYSYRVRAVRSGISQAVFLESDSAFNIPCMQLNGDKFSITFMKTENPLLWAPDLNTFTEITDYAFECISIEDDFSFTVPYMNNNGRLYSIKFNYSLIDTLWTPDFNSVVMHGDIDIKLGSIPTIDGIFSQDEWNDAGSTQIIIEPGWSVPVLYKHDGSNLYIAFTNLINNGRAMFPEVLLDVNNDKTIAWGSDDWWFHASAFDCEANGAYSVWSACQQNLEGWEANNFLRPQDIVEMKISYLKLGLIPSRDKTLGIAFDVTDNINNWSLWPVKSTISNPATWAVAKSSDGWIKPASR